MGDILYVYSNGIETEYRWELYNSFYLPTYDWAFYCWRTELLN